MPVFFLSRWVLSVIFAPRESRDSSALRVQGLLNPPKLLPGHSGGQLLSVKLHPGGFKEVNNPFWYRFPTGLSSPTQKEVFERLCRFLSPRSGEKGQHTANDPSFPVSKAFEAADLPHRKTKASATTETTPGESGRVFKIPTGKTGKRDQKRTKVSFSRTPLPGKLQSTVRTQTELKGYS